MPTRPDKFWWRPLGRRIFRWGVWGALLLDVAPLAIVAWLSYQLNFYSGRESVAEVTGNWFDALVLSVAIAGILTSPIALMGAMLGWACGFYAPASEPKNPFKSQFCRIVAAQALLSWALACAVLGAGGAVFYFVLFGGARLSPYTQNYLIFGAVAVAVVAFGFCLWRGVNCALRAASQAN